MQDDPPEYENPRVSCINRRACHTRLYAFTDAEDARAFWQEHAGSTEARWQLDSTLRLSGTDWLFSLFEKPSSVPAHLLSPDSTVEQSMSMIHVPSNWMLTDAGSDDIPIYTNQLYCFPLDPPRARRVGSWRACNGKPDDQGADVGWEWCAASGTACMYQLENPTGVYRRRFHVPTRWLAPGATPPASFTARCRAFIVFEGVESAFYCYLNGTFVGYSQDSRLPAEFEVTDLLNEGNQNVLAVQNMRFCDGSYLEDQDQWWLAGIHRDVFLYKTPQTRIADFSVTPHVLSSSLPAPSGNTGATIDIEVCIEEEVLSDGSLRDGSAAVENFFIDASLFEPSAGDCVCAQRVQLTNAMRYMHGGAVVTASLILHSAALWSPERPHLYTAVIELRRSVDLCVQQVESCRIGVRRVNVNGDAQLCTNGMPVLIAGVNHHEHDDTHGKAVSLSQLYDDLAKMKQHNFNAVRTSHYPHHPRFYDFCDELGLYVCDEANLETHGFRVAGQPTSFLANRPDWENAMVERHEDNVVLAQLQCTIYTEITQKRGFSTTCVCRVTRMVKRDKNHASIIIWSLGNEAGLGTAQRRAAKEVKRMDSTRAVQYESGGSFKGTSDIICPMYARVSAIVQWAEDEQDKRPIVLCEYSHAMNNSNGNLDEYWRAFTRHKRLQGGFIWDWTDQALLKRHANDCGSFWAYGGDFGDKPNDGPFCLNGITFPDRSSKPALVEASHLQQPLVFQSAQVCGNEVYLEFCSIREHFSLSLLPWTLRWEVWTDGGDCLATAAFDRSVRNEFETSPGEHGRLSLGKVKDVIPQSKDTLEPGTCVYISLKIALTQPLPWAPTGWIIAYDKLRLPLPAPLQPPPLLKPSPARVDGIDPRVDVDDGNIIQISNGLGLSVTFSREGSCGGAPSKIKFGREHVVAYEGPMLCFYRAPTDNDKGGAGLSFAERWKRAGLDKLDLVTPANLTYYTSQSSLGNTAIVVRSQYELSCRGQAREPKIHVESDFLIGTGTGILCNYNIHVEQNFPCLARVGTVTRVPAEHGKIAEWLGCGPHESYPDRKASAKYGCYREHVHQLSPKYIVPSESGGRASCSYFALYNATKTRGLFVASAPWSDPVQVSAQEHTLSELESAAHQHELPPPGDSVFLHVDHAHHGLGGDDSWTPSTLEAFRVQPGRFNFSQHFEALSPSEGSVAADARYRALLSSYPSKPWA